MANRHCSSKARLRKARAAHTLSVVLPVVSIITTGWIDPTLAISRRVSAPWRAKFASASAALCRTLPCPIVNKRARHATAPLSTKLCSRSASKARPPRVAAAWPASSEAPPAFSSLTNSNIAPASTICVRCPASAASCASVPAACSFAAVPPKSRTETRADVPGHSPRLHLECGQTARRCSARAALACVARSPCDKAATRHATPPASTIAAECGASWPTRLSNAAAACACKLVSGPASSATRPLAPPWATTAARASGLLHARRSRSKAARACPLPPQPLLPNSSMSTKMAPTSDI
mmetsp:Transcript_116666/g.371148  ORF Transcript_116666/g.371148 Transcript_116666/m.371148 type:complete len:295 (+) Transcript_116666:1275-2159(+)